VDLVGRFGGRWLAWGLGAGVLARLPWGLLGVRLGLALGKGSGLALAGTQGQVALTAEPLVLGLQMLDAPLKGLVVATPNRLHAGMIRSSGTRGGSDGKREGFSLSVGRQSSAMRVASRFGRDSSSLRV
jgi:hypothetical protein